MQPGFWKTLLRHKSSTVGLCMLVGILTLAAIGLPAYLNQTTAQQPEPEIRFMAPGGDHWLGTDNLGRSVFKRICIGATLSLGISLAVVTFALLVGVSLGSISAYVGGWLDSLLMRLVDIMLAFPSIVLAMTIMAVWGRGADKLVIAIGIPLIPGFIRQVRAAVLVNKELDYVDASKALGAGHLRVLLRDILPNSMGPIIVISTLSIGTAILDIAGLSFLGLGVTPGQPEWGTMLQEAGMSVSVEYREWWVIVFPGLTIALTVLGFNLLGDGLRDTLDPKMKKNR